MTLTTEGYTGRRVFSVADVVSGIANESVLCVEGCEAASNVGFPTAMSSAMRFAEYGTQRISLAAAAVLVDKE